MTMTASYTCHACLTVHHFDQTVMGKYSKIKNRDTRRVRFCRRPGCKCTTFLRFEGNDMDYLGYTLTDILKGRVARCDMHDIVQPLARRVAVLEREVRMIYRADGTARECTTIEEAKALRIEAARQLQDMLKWNTADTAPLSANADRELIAVLKSGKVVSGEVRVDGSPFGHVFIQSSDGFCHYWEDIALWTYKPEVA